ncbi:MAG TPA: aminotransferase class III-fold pyridoxal phosphate-dependent enzyme [Acidimicrobiia bacterium]|nr:aminotransferase class III-fold pyridoxal phosphate-dependent enzyme [Acidimicrobiia bacterium]
MSAFLHPFSPPRMSEFVTIVGGEGAEVWDTGGNRYIDGMASLWYMNVGHGHPRMIEAITSQARALASYHTFAPFSNVPAETLADTIIELSPFARGRVFLTTSGSEAVDSAMKLARIAQREAGRPHKTMIVSREHGYHGTNFGGTSAQGIAVNREGFGELVGNVVNVPGPDIEPMARLFAEHGDSIAAVLSEPLQGAGGVFPPPEGYLDGLRALCDEYDAFLILDEVITGFGRLGTWFGAQHYDIRPDMITFAKASSSGYIPLGGVILGPEVTDALMANEGFALKHGYTYSGHPIAAAAGSAAIAIQRDEGLLERVPLIERRLGDGLAALAGDGLVSEVRGTGAVWAIQLPEHRDAMKDRDDVLGQGVIVRPLGNSLVMCPPLVVTDSQVDRMVDALAAVLSR